jgi:hypothetical protein
MISNIGTLKLWATWDKPFNVKYTKPETPVNVKCMVSAIAFSMTYYFLIVTVQKDN